jgi:uncharacterized phage protein (TIGR01671 family)
MRTIKFRGKSLSGEWLYGYLYKHGITPPSDFLCVGQAVLPWKDTVGVYVVDPDTVGQYTGLTDKNGREIYEGDIVSHPWKDPIFGDLVETGQFVHSTICFNNGAFVVNYRLQGEYIYLQDFVRLKCLEVVGNIHDNPDMIEKGGDNA